MAESLTCALKVSGHWKAIKMGKVFVVVLIVIGVLLLFNLDKFSSRSKAPPTGVSPAVISNGRQGQVLPPNRSTPTPPLPTASPTPSAQQRLQAVADQMGITVLVTQQAGNEVHAKVEWAGDVATIGGDYIEQLYREGVIFDFDANTTGQRWYDNQGRSRWVQNFVLKMR
jgi:hypothetical protein